jgi:hypothetical protein
MVLSSFKKFLFPKSLGMEANGFGAGADPSQGGGEARVHRQTLDEEHGSVKEGREDTEG